MAIITQSENKTMMTDCLKWIAFLLAKEAQAARKRAAPAEVCAFRVLWLGADCSVSLLFRFQRVRGAGSLPNGVAYMQGQRPI